MPELINSFINRKNELLVSEIYLIDIDREKLNIVGKLSMRMLKANYMETKAVMTEDLR